MITLHFHLIPQYKYELFHIYFTLLVTITAHFIQGPFGLSEPFKAKFIEEINL